MMSPDLIAFLKAWRDWVANGAPDGEPYYRFAGLCANAMNHGNYGDAGERLSRELLNMFSAFEDEQGYPFGGEEEYTARCIARTQHECPKRLAWVCERLIEAGELVE